MGLRSAEGLTSHPNPASGCNEVGFDIVAHRETFVWPDRNRCQLPPSLSSVTLAVALNNKGTSSMRGVRGHGWHSKLLTACHRRQTSNNGQSLGQGRAQTFQEAGVQPDTTTHKGTLETGRAKGHVLCTCRALYVYVPAVNLIGIGMLKYMLRMKHLYILLFIAQTWSSRSFFILILSPMCVN